MMTQNDTSAAREPNHGLVLSQGGTKAKDKAQEGTDGASQPNLCLTTACKV